MHAAFKIGNKINLLQDELCQDLINLIFPIFVIGGQPGGLARVGVEDQTLDFGQQGPNGKIPPDHVVQIFGPFSFNVLKEFLHTYRGRCLLQLHEHRKEYYSQSNPNTGLCFGNTKAASNLDSKQKISQHQKLRSTPSKNRWEHGNAHFACWS